MIKLPKARKGFVFTLLVLVMLVFMITELNIYFRTYQLKQETEPLTIRSLVLTELGSQLEQNKMSKLSYVVEYNSLYKLTESPTTPPSIGDIENILWTMIWNGTRVDLGGSQVIPRNHTLSVWDENMRMTADTIGFELNTSYSNFRVGQSDPFTVQMNYTFEYLLSDSVSGAMISNRYPVVTNISIIGFEDPLIGRSITNVQRNIIPSAQPDQWVTLDYTGELGRGWFYGNVTKVTDGSQITFDASNKKRILVTNNLQVAETYGNIFGAVAIIGASIPGSESFPTISVPLFANATISYNIFPSTPILIMSDSDDTLTRTGPGTYHRIYNIEALRNTVTCGSYTNYSRGYSFLNRLTNNLVQDEHGLETMLSGSGVWITEPSRSVVDYAYFNSTPGTKIMGLVGCSDRLMCNSTPSSNYAYPTRLDPFHINAYNASDLVCSGDRCG